MVHVDVEPKGPNRSGLEVSQQSIQDSSGI